MNFGNSSAFVRRLPALALAAVAVWLLAKIGFTAWDIARFEPPAPAAFSPAVSADKAAAQAPGAGLFGSPRQRARTNASPDVLRGGNFRLTGVVASANRKLAHAIIETGGASDTYFIGDTLASGIRVQEVRPNEVLLRRGGEVLRLPLSNASLSTGASPSPNLLARAGGGGALGGDLLARPRESLSQLVNMEPVMDADGRMEGYRLTPRARKAWFDSLGLVSGDLLLAVNGIGFDANNMAQARQEMSSGNDMMLTVERDGEKLEVSVGSDNFGLLAM